MEKEVLVSKEGLENLKGQLKQLEEVELKDIARKIAEAKDMGDLSENAEYHEAKQQQAFLFGKAQTLKYKIKNAKVIEKCGNGQVLAGSSVDVVADGQKMTFDIVGSEEADPTEGKISVESPIGSALLGKKSGEKVKVKTPAGETEYVVGSIK